MLSKLHPTSLHRPKILLLLHRRPKSFFLPVRACLPIGTQGTRTLVCGPLSVRCDLRQRKVPVHEPRVREEDAAGEEDLDVQAAGGAHTAAGGDEVPRGGEKGAQVRYAGVVVVVVVAVVLVVAHAAKVGGADLEFAGPFDRRIGEDIGADIGDAEAEIAHLGQVAEEVADVFVGRQVAGVWVVEAIVRPGGVLEDLQGVARGRDQGQHAGDGDGGQVGDVEAFQARGGAGDEGQVGVGDGFVEGVAEDFQPAETAKGDARVFQGVRGAVSLERVGLIAGQADGLELEGVEGRAQPRAPVEEVHPVGARGSAEDGPGRAEVLEVPAVRDDGEDEAVRLGRVEPVEPQPAHVPRHARDGAEEAVGLLQRAVGIAVDVQPRRPVDQLVEAVLVALVRQVGPTLRAAPPALGDRFQVVAQRPFVPARTDLADGLGGIPAEGFGAERAADVFGEFGGFLEGQRRLGEPEGVVRALGLVGEGRAREDVGEDFLGEGADVHSYVVWRASENGGDGLCWGWRGGVWWGVASGACGGPCGGCGGRSDMGNHGTA